MSDAADTETEADDASPALALPPQMGLDAAAKADHFLITGDHANLWFAPRRSDTLLITFDNLATIDEGWPRGPWLSRRLEPLGHSILGVQSHAKDWFRQPTAPDLLRGLEARGFFRRFSRVVMIGASMGGFAALNFAPLIPEARVLAFSPQSTMNKDIAPFEARFPFAVRKSNWKGMPFLDAAAAIPYIRKVALVYDPFVPEDATHAARMAGPNVQLLPAPFCTHEAIRVVIKSGALLGLVQEMVAGDAVSAFWRSFRARKSVPKWQKSLLGHAVQRGHLRLAVQAADAILRAGEGLPAEELVFARRVRREALKQAKAG
jgi:pimeloyl-ACP methyl ester carboxylesterase